MPVMRLKLTMSVIVSLVTLGSAASAQFTEKQINGYRQSVVRVDATGCTLVPGGNLVGSGFFWKQSNWVVTALHVINGCSSISVYSDVALDSSPAHVAKILLADDLALLALDKSISGTVVLATAKDAPQNTQDLLLVGFPGDSSGSTGKTVRRQFSGNTLAQIASYMDQQELAQTKSPALDAIVIFLQGTLEHGHSGGPIFDDAGDVVAIADGGLKHGTTEDSWAIPSQDLVTLPASPDSLSNMVQQRSSLLFAATPITNSGPSLACGGGVFKHLKTIKYADVVATADDPHGLQQLASVSSISPSSFSFEVYQDPSTGASIVLPGGEVLSSQDGTCYANSAGGGVAIHAKIANTAGDPTGQSAGLAFETQVQGLTQGGWVYAQAFSYPQALPVLGGGVAWRKDWVHYVLLPGVGQTFDGQQFETLAMRGNILLGTAAINSKWTPLVVQTQQACLLNSSVSPHCTEALQDYKDWIESVLAVHLSNLAGF